jgi:hypothetical protein
MEWQKYQKRYSQFVLSISQIRILRLVVAEIFQDFPNRLPQKSQISIKKIADMLSQLAEILPEKYPDNLKEYPNEVNINSFIDSSPYKSFADIYENPLYYPVINLVGAQASLGITQSEIDYERLICHQELTMIFAHLEAFMADTIRGICKIRPGVLKKKNRSIENYIYHFGMSEMPKRFEQFQKDLEIRLSYPGFEDDILLLVLYRTLTTFCSS